MLRAMLEINVIGTFLCAQAAAREMATNGGGWTLLSSHDSAGGYFDTNTALFTGSVGADGPTSLYSILGLVDSFKRDGKFDVDIYDAALNSMKGTPIEDILVKRAQLTVLMKCTGVWFAGGKFGLSWKAEQIRADKVPASIRGPAFLPDESGGATAASQVAKNQFAALADEEDDDEVNDEEALASPPPAKAAAQPEEDEEEDAPEVVSPAAVPKKTVVKKLVKKVAGK
jgi:NAD(P)-dependent dehydrogenase (short-subunit alcohol dehydrogenase family)